MSLLLEFLYHTVIGRMLLKLLTRRRLSELVGSFMDSPLSCLLIPSFIKKNKIDLSECQRANFVSFNDCFTRQLRPELRPIDKDPANLISPCDGLLTIYKIHEDTVLPIKQSRYSITDLLGDREMAEEFQDGICLVFRLCVNHYHRYCYLDDGHKGDNRFIPGLLHTVQPVALRELPVFTQNCREVTLMETDNFGSVAQVEVGAMLVGKIKNHQGAGPVRRGEEKGLFLYGGSTIVVLLKKNAARLDPDFKTCARRGEEIPVKMGQVIGRRTKT